jgi:hypothetical protein
MSVDETKNTEKNDTRGKGIVGKSTGIGDN